MSLEFVAILPPFMESTERAHHQTMSGEMSCTSYCFSVIYIYIYICNNSTFKRFCSSNW